MITESGINFSFYHQPATTLGFPGEILNWSLYRELRGQERGRLLQLVGGRFNEKGNLPGLSLVVEKPSRSPHLLVCVLGLYGDLNGVKLYVQSRFQ